MPHAGERRVPRWKLSAWKAPSLTQVEDTVKGVWERPVWSWLLILSTTACCFWFWIKPPLPGVAIAVLGGAVAVMAFRDMHSTHKLLATLAIFALMGIELHDITKDREASDKQQSDDRKKANESFTAIADGIKVAITNSQVQFLATMKRSGIAVGLAREEIAIATGGDSYPVFYPLPKSLDGTTGLPLVAIVRGKHDLRVATITVMDLS